LLKGRDFICSNNFFYAVLFIGMLVMVFPFGLRYYTFSDDWFSLGLLSYYRTNIWQDGVLRYGLHGFRPIAGLLEIYVVSAFWPNVWVVLLGITMLRFATILLLHGIFEKCNVTWGRFAVVFFAFFPTLTEATYWLSASVRVVIGSFLSVLAAYAILKFVNYHSTYEKENPLSSGKGIFHPAVWLAIAFFSGFVANGFYEQGIVFTFVMTMGVLLLNYKKITRKWIFAWPVANLLTIIVHHIIFWDTHTWLGNRAGVESNFFAQIPRVLRMIWQTMRNEQVPTFVNTFEWGFAFLLREHLWLIVIVGMLSVALAYCVAVDATKEFGLKSSVLVGAVLCVSTLSIFFVIADSAMFVRNLYYSLIGLAIFIGIGVQFVRIKAVRGMIAALLIFVFACGYIMEVETLRRIERYDSHIITQLVDKLDNSETESIFLFGTRWTYVPSINPRYASQLRSGWSATAHFRYIYWRENGVRTNCVIQPIHHGEYMYLSDSPTFGIDQYMTVRWLYLDGEYLKFVDTGEIFGTMAEHVGFWQR